jgi:hypothetical protein
MKRPHIPPRRRIFLGCEGDSERGYGALLSNLLRERCHDVHLDVVLLRPGGGDSLTLVERARDHIIQSEERKGYPPYVVRGLLLDGDLRGIKQRRDREALEIATDIALTLIWQEPCHEALLLRHLDGCSHLRPPTSSGAKAKLLQPLSRVASIRATTVRPHSNLLHHGDPTHSLAKLDFGLSRALIC